MAKMNIMTDEQMKTIGKMLERMDEEQTEALTMFGAQMYTQGWVDNALKFFAAGVLVGAFSVAMPLMFKKRGEHKER